MTPSPFLSPDTEPAEELHAASPTAHLLDELALYGHRPGRNEPDPRPLPEADAVRAEIGAIVDGFAAMLADTRLEDDLDDLLWSFVNLFHRKIGRVERDLDANEQAQRRSQREQNGSEVRSVELERLIDQGVGLIERRNAFEFSIARRGRPWQIAAREGCRRAPLTGPGVPPHASPPPSGPTPGRERWRALPTGQAASRMRTNCRTSAGAS